MEAPLISRTAGGRPVSALTSGWLVWGPPAPMDESRSRCCSVEREQLPPSLDVHLSVGGVATDWPAVGIDCGGRRRRQENVAGSTAS